jgi:hypothetical protein
MSLNMFLNTICFVQTSYLYIQFMVDAASWPFAYLSFSMFKACECIQLVFATSQLVITTFPLCYEHIIIITL